MLSVLMPVKAYHPPFLREAVNSVLAQSSSRWQLLVIADRGSRRRLERELPHDPRIELIVRERPSLANAFNVGMRHTETEFVAILLGDDAWAPHAVAVLERNIKAAPSTDFFHSSRRFVDDDGAPLSSVYLSRKSVSPLDDYLRGETPVKHLLCWRRELGLEVGGMDETLGSIGVDDYDFPWTMAEHGATFTAVPECLYVVRDHRTSFRLTTHRSRAHQTRELARIMSKHGTRPEVIADSIRRAESGYLRQTIFRTEGLRRLRRRDPSGGAREHYERDYQPMATVIVAARNAERTIDACVRSLLALRYPPERLELIVVDNGSSDRTRQLLERYRDRVTVIEERRRGAAAARNAGLAAARGEVVAFTDADATVDPDWLRRLLAPLEDEEVGIAGGPILSAPGAGAVERFGERIHDQRLAITVFNPPYVASANWASRGDLLRRLGGFDARFRRGQDVDLSYRVLQAGYRLEFAPRAPIYHRNESTVPGLAREGFQHGYHGVRVLKRHESWLRTLGHGARSRPTYRDVAVSLLRAQSRYEGIFNAGKKAGKLLGSVRFGHLAL